MSPSDSLVKKPSLCTGSFRLLKSRVVTSWADVRWPNINATANACKSHNTTKKLQHTKDTTKTGNPTKKAARLQKSCK